jgi:hypothetical protein
MPALGMTDHGNLFGAVQFYNSDCEVCVSNEGHKTRSTSDRFHYLALLFENQEGFCRKPQRQRPACRPLQSSAKTTFRRGSVLKRKGQEGSGFYVLAGI